jgi:phage terminase small subunit
VGLTPKPQRFIEEYLVDLNATQAAIRAGYSPQTAYSIASENLKKPEIQTAIAQGHAAKRAELGLTYERILREYAAVAFGTMKRLATWDQDRVTLTPSDELSDAEAAAVGEVSVPMAQNLHPPKDAAATATRSCDHATQARLIEASARS